jgi:large subunit ribosomal protein L30e
MASRMVTKTKPEASAGGQQVLARVLKEAMKSGKYTFGAKEVISNMKTSKMVILASTTANRSKEEEELSAEAEKHKVAVLKIGRSSAQLGRMIGRPFRVSAIALRVVAEGDYRALVGSPSQPAKAPA